jgi:hypothetical protein
MIEADRVLSTPRRFTPIPDNNVAAALLRLSERELTPKDVLTELFEEELLQYPDLLADLVIARLGVKGFEIRPVDYTKREG